MLNQGHPLNDVTESFIEASGPSELASFHPESFAILEGYGTECMKSDFYDLLLPDFSLVFTRDKRVHNARRNVWSRALSTKGKSCSTTGCHNKKTLLLTFPNKFADQYFA